MLADLGSAARRGDVIILRLPSGFSAKIPTGGDYVKRVIGLPGDRVACCDSRGRVTVNSKPLNETYLYPGDPPSTAPFSVTLGSGQLWVLGDHRSDAVDSRIWGPVPQSDVVGRVEEKMTEDRSARCKHLRRLSAKGSPLRTAARPQSYFPLALAPRQR